MVKAVATCAQFTAGRPLAARLREAARDAVVCGLGLLPCAAGTGWVRFPFYHHVYDDECRGFERHLSFLKDRGEFLSLDDAVALLASGQPVDGRYFCLTFDDGLAGCRHAIDILAARGLPAAIYVAADLIGQAFAPGDPVATGRFGYRGTDGWLGFLSWDQCRAAHAAGIAIGSHTGGHVALARLNDDDALDELTRSRQRIEAELGAPCRHFCAPFGLPVRHYRPDRDPALARAAGYLSFATGLRGPNRAGQDVFALRRDQLLAGWSTAQLRYFLSRP